MNHRTLVRIAGLGFALLVMTGTPAFAQVDLEGIWTPIMHED
jgi:hypothetical protein